MRSIEINGKTIPLDKEGYLELLSDWDEEVAKQLAANDAISLTPAHWEVIYLLRDFHNEFEHAPAMRILVKAAKKKLGDEKGTSIYLLGLFPDSPAKRAAKIAGLPRPTNCL
ncbi:sulfurtransferase TusE [Gammaproteobacteria bacterium 45_16_T64]|nr:sulfurtransferase TusE [Gammaproteobacteria bacterium 45_16_T64]